MRRLQQTKAIQSERKFVQVANQTLNARIHQAIRSVLRTVRLVHQPQYLIERAVASRPIKRLTHGPAGLAIIH